MSCGLSMNVTHAELTRISNVNNRFAIGESERLHYLGQVLKQIASRDAALHTLWQSSFLSDILSGKRSVGWSDFRVAWWTSPVWAFSGVLVPGASEGFLSATARQNQHCCILCVYKSFGSVPGPWAEPVFVRQQASVFVSVCGFFLFPWQPFEDLPLSSFCFLGVETESGFSWSGHIEIFVELAGNSRPPILRPVPLECGKIRPNCTFSQKTTQAHYAFMADRC